MTGPLTMAISPALTSTAPPTWAGSVWIGEVWRDDVDALARQRDATGHTVRCRLTNPDGYRHARLLVRTQGRIHGFVELASNNGEIDFAELARLVDAATTPTASVTDRRTLHGRHRSVTVVICTRDRPHLLPAAVEAVLAQDYRDFDLIVVDNASSTSATSDYVEAVRDPRVRLVREPVPGVARARNTGLRAATGDVVAYVDDDAIVDRFWLTALLAGFDQADAVGCVSGLVPAGEIRTAAQVEFDRRVHWSTPSAARVFDLNDPPSDVPLFPFAVGEYGTGANFALDRRAALQLGGFDDHLGVGSTTHGGEDLDIFFRVLWSGRQLVLEPAAIAWHRHRDSDDALSQQIHGYAMGLGAWLAKIAGNPRTAALAAKVAVTRAFALRDHLSTPSYEIPPTVVLRGAFAYARARFRSRRKVFARP